MLILSQSECRAGLVHITEHKNVRCMTELVVQKTPLLLVLTLNRFSSMQQGGRLAAISQGSYDV